MLLSKLLSRTTFDSYADFKKNYELRVPARFNFARDVVDAWAEADPRKRALVWLNDRGERREFTFAEISELSKKAANYLSSLGLKKGDRILTLLKRNWQYWVTAVACHRMGVVIIPASVQLATKDIVYRVNFAGIRAILMHEALPQLRIRTGQIALKQRIERTDRLGHGQLQLRRIDVTAALSHILIMIITKQHDASSGA